MTYAGPAIRNPQSAIRNGYGYTLIEMLTTVAVLVIVLGLMVSLARHVRERAAVALTKDLLRRLDQAVAQYAARHDVKLPPVSPFPPPSLLAAAATDPAAPGVQPGPPLGSPPAKSR